MARRNRRSPEELRILDDRLAALAQTQHGLISRRQALERGLTSSAVQTRVTSGDWECVERGVYAYRGAPKTRQRDILQACLGGGKDAVASFFTAAELWNLCDVPRQKGLHLTIPRENHSRRAGVTTHRSITFKRSSSAPNSGLRSVPKPTEDERTVLDGIPVTSPLRTLIDVAKWVRRDRLETALMDLIRRRLATPLEVLEAARRHKFRVGIGKLRRILASGAYLKKTRSTLEDRAVQILTRAGRRDLKTNVNIVYAGKFIGEADIVFERQKLIVEMDGAVIHGVGYRQTKDEWRDIGYRAAGYAVLHRGWADLLDPSQFLADIQRESEKPRPAPMSRAEFIPFWAKTCTTYARIASEAQR